MKVKKEKLSGANKSEEGVLGADVIRSEYRLVAPAPAVQREIVSESTVSYDLCGGFACLNYIIYLIRGT